jgi:asparagine synthase (glutamine-hydrolysing)
MCGIAGLWDFGKNAADADLLSMTATLSRRGPDDVGLFTNQEDGIGLGHRRLSILDLSSRGRQPMADAAGSVRVTFNGEIYNYREIRQELVARGHQFRTNTDTEVILHAYNEWGTNCLARFRGMFAFALWDVTRKKLVLCRDRLGVKPLYYYYDGRLLLFASELKALMAHPGFRKNLHAGALALYLQFGCVPAPRSIFTNTSKVRPGCYVEISSDGELKERSYWRVDDYRAENGDGHLTEAQVEDELVPLLREAFAYRLVSDVPVGIFLSGGIDSSLVAAVLKREAHENIRTFTVGFDDASVDESHWAKAVARHLGAEHTEFRCSEQEALQIVTHLPEIYDEPFSDASAVPTYLLCKAARDQVKVALSADGGDEFFCGYSHYMMFAGVWEQLARIPVQLRGVLSAAVKTLRLIPRRGLEPLLAETCRRFFSGLEPADLSDKLLKLSHVLESPSFHEAYISALSIWPKEELRRLATGLRSRGPVGVQSSSGAMDTPLEMMLTDAQMYLPDDLLVKVDRASMAVGLEVREPLLDHRLVEYAIALPHRFKYQGGTSKYILRRILYKYVPRHLVDRRKQGFSVPLAGWLRSALKPLALRALDPVRIRRQGIFSPAYVKRIVDPFMEGARVSAKKVWNLLQFQLWHQRWLEA